MKLILDLNEQTVQNMQGYAQAHNITINELVETLFNKYAQEPATAIDKLHVENGNLNVLNEFSKLLMEYMNEAIFDIEESAVSDEAYETDNAMANVFRKLNRDYLNEAYILINLFKAFKEG